METKRIRFDLIGVLFGFGFHKGVVITTIIRQFLSLDERKTKNIYVLSRKNQFFFFLLENEWCVCKHC